MISRHEAKSQLVEAAKQLQRLGYDYWNKLEYPHFVSIETDGFQFVVEAVLLERLKDGLHVAISMSECGAFLGTRVPPTTSFLVRKPEFTG